MPASWTEGEFTGMAPAGQSHGLDGGFTRGDFDDKSI
jgi:hypothetical protein